MKQSMAVRFSRRVALGVGIAAFGVSIVSQGDQGNDPADRAGFDGLSGMAVEELDTARGREGVQLDLVNVQSVQDLDAASFGSSFDVSNGDMVSGAITFESGAMGHYSGTGIFNNVTGNANAINNAIGISIYISNP